MKLHEIAEMQKKQKERIVLGHPLYVSSFVFSEDYTGLLNSNSRYMTYGDDYIKVEAALSDEWYIKEPEIKPCPGCKGKMRLANKTLEDEKIYLYYLACPQCNLKLTRKNDPGDYNFSETKEEFIARWNCIA